MSIQIATADGSCPAYEFRPSGTGPWPAVLLYIDGIGMRPAMHPIAQRIAQHGYYVLMPDLFYRLGTYVAPEPAKLFGDPEVRDAWFKQARTAVNPEGSMRDTEAFLAHIAGLPDVKQPKVGVVGYCMGGRMALTAAGTFPDRVAAAAAYHPGGLATDAPDSPHLLAGKIAGRVFIGAAKEDQSFDLAQQQRLRAALDGAGVRYELVEFDAKHGWVPSDTPVHDAAQAERQFETMFALFDATLS